MQWFLNLGLRWKITLPLILLLLLFLVSSLYSIKTSRNQANDAQLVGNIFLKQINYLLQADRDLYQSYVAENILVYQDASDSDAQEAHRENAEQALERASNAIRLGEMINPDGRLRDFEARYKVWYDISQRIVDAAASGNQAMAQSLSRGEGKSAFEAVRSLIDEIQEEQITQANRFTNLAETHSSDAQTALWIKLLVGLAIGIAIILFIPGLIIKPIQRISDNLADLASGEGDLTARLPVSGKDEIGELAQRFNSFLEKLHGLVKHIKEGAEKVDGASSELSNIAETNRSAMQTQNMSLDMVVSAVHEMSTAIREVAENTNNTADQARNANQRSENGQATVEQTVNKIQQVASQVNEVSDLVTEVEQQVGSVTSVLDVIRGIAEQTNLLALNAAIEAARAGEQGRGFAVVADEVRTLASRTQESTTDIQAMLERLQAGVANAAESMRFSAESANSTVSVANEAGLALNEITQSVSTITEMAVQIAAAVEEQSAVIEDINRNLASISEQSVTTSDNAERTSNASEQLDVAATALIRDVGSFKL